MTRLGDVCEKIGSGATPRGGKEAYKETGIPIIRSQNVHDWAFQSSGLAFLDDEQAKALANGEVHSNDILLNITGDSVARACEVPAEHIPARVNQHVAIIRAGKEINPTYLLAFLQFKKAELLNLASSGATRNALTKKMIENLDINLPSRKKQDSVATLLDSIQSKIAINAQLNDYLPVA
jgi:type I restriction enzyme S subunit